ncbi:MAG: PHP domain-containing protein, partial [Methanomicrobia archaeon]|nr:PHP domain-containing protein [Methanomicrobia archaeon]
MENREIAKIFYEISEILRFQGESFKSRAYFLAARKLEKMKNLREYYEKNELEKIPGIGKNLAKKIVEYFETGKISYLEKIKKGLPMGIDELLTIPGIGPKTALFLYKELNIKSLNDLEKSIKKHEIMKIKGEKLEKNLERGLKIVKTKRRMLLSEAFEIAEELSRILENFEVAGSFRRRKETVGDLDIILTKIDETSLKDFQILAKGEKKITAIYKNVQIDFRIVKNEEIGSSLQYFTGNKEHNIKLRRIAQKKGYKLNEYGLFKGNNRINTNERDIYEKLDMEWIPPELRENTGEIEAALEGKLPKLVDIEDIKGDLHIHTKWSDGLDSIENVVKKAKELNYEYVAITDHSPTVPEGNGLSEEKLLEQWEILESYDNVLKGV